MHIEAVPNRQSHPTILLRESYRVGAKVKKRTLANLTNWPEPLVEGLRTLLRGGVAVATADEALTIGRSLPHGHVAAVLGMAEQTGLAKLLTDRRGGRSGASPGRSAPPCRGRRRRGRAAASGRWSAPRPPWPPPRRRARACAALRPAAPASW